MSTKKASELRQLMDEELVAAEQRAQEELFQLRFQHHTAQLSDTSQLPQKRRELARIRTVQAERAQGLTSAPSVDQS